MSPKPNPIDKDSKDSISTLSVGSTQVAAGIGTSQNINIGVSTSNIAGSSGSNVNTQGKIFSIRIFYKIS